MGTTESDKRHYFVEIVLSRTGFVDAGSEHALHQAYLLLPLAVCPAGFIGRNKSQEAVPRALHWDHLTSTVTSTETPWHPDKSSSLFDVTFSGLGSTERFLLLGLTCRPPVILELGSVGVSRTLDAHAWSPWPSPVNNGIVDLPQNEGAPTCGTSTNIGSGAQYKSPPQLLCWARRRYDNGTLTASVVTGFHQVSRQDGLTPCHLMLSLSDRFQDMGPLFKAKRREHGVQDMVHATHNGLT
ncbi:uncharacterized protein [Dermacentor albipictus]|uniref:uncharacterized protein isoform X2 n=1 Tax=Dermacentor albipictus TaxID=60249 RepID=UPI0038FC2E84